MADQNDWWYLPQYTAGTANIQFNTSANTSYYPNTTFGQPIYVGGPDLRHSQYPAQPPGVAFDPAKAPDGSSLFEEVHPSQRGAYPEIAHLKRRVEEVTQLAFAA